MSKPDNFNIQQLIENLQGTCKSLQEGCTDFDFNEEDLTEEDHEKINEEIFNCTECGWWYEISDEAENDDENDRICLNCKED